MLRDPSSLSPLARLEIMRPCILQQFRIPPALPGTQLSP